MEDMSEWITMLSSPVGLLVIGYILNRSGKKRDEKHNDLVKLIGANAKLTMDNHNSMKSSLKEFWNTFREDQKEQAKQIGFLEGKIDGK